MKNFLEISYCANVEGWKFLWLVLFLHAREGWIHEFWMNMQLASAFSKYVTHPQKFLFVIPAMVSEYVRFSAAGTDFFFFSCSYKYDFCHWTFCRMLQAAYGFRKCLNVIPLNFWRWTYFPVPRKNTMLLSFFNLDIKKKKNTFLKMEEELLACE